MSTQSERTHVLVLPRCTVAAVQPKAAVQGRQQQGITSCNSSPSPGITVESSYVTVGLRINTCLHVYRALLRYCIFDCRLLCVYYIHVENQQAAPLLGPRAGTVIAVSCPESTGGSNTPRNSSIMLTAFVTGQGAAVQPATPQATAIVSVTNPPLSLWKRRQGPAVCLAVYPAAVKK